LPGLALISRVAFDEGRTDAGPRSGAGDSESPAVKVRRSIMALESSEIAL
jgi:hypothetical protein